MNMKLLVDSLWIRWICFLTTNRLFECNEQGLQYCSGLSTSRVVLLRALRRSIRLSAARVWGPIRVARARARWTFISAVFEIFPLSTTFDERLFFVWGRVRTGVCVQPRATWDVLWRFNSFSYVVDGVLLVLVLKNSRLLKWCRLSYLDHISWSYFSRVFFI